MTNEKRNRLKVEAVIDVAFGGESFGVFRGFGKTKTEALNNALNHALELTKMVEKTQREAIR